MSTRLESWPEGERVVWNGDVMVVRQCAAGVFVARSTLFGDAGANAVIVDLGGRTVLIDSGLTQAGGRELATAAQALTGRPLSVLLNTHHHSDHLWGNGGVLAGCAGSVERVTSTGTCQLLLTSAAAEPAWIRAQAPGEIAHIEAVLGQSGAATDRVRLEGERAFYRAALAELDLLVVHPPTLTFDRRLRLFGSERTLEAICYGEGHTRSDTIGWIPEAGVLVTGDLVTVDAHPYLADGDALEWLHVLRVLKTHQPHVVIPGHGPLAGAAALDAMRDTIEQLLELADGAPLDEEGFEDAETEEWLENVPAPEPCAEWAFGSFFGRNLRHEVRRLSRGRRNL